MRFRLVNRLQAVTLVAEGAPGGTPFLVDGVERSASTGFPSAPFQTHTLEAPGGVPIEAGVRAGFEGWTDSPARSRTVTTGLADTTYTARFGRREVEVAVTHTGAPLGVIPGTIELEGGTDDGWAPEGAQVTIRATPRVGFRFVEWAGALAGSPNPVSLSLDSPLQAEARYDQTFAVDAPAVVDLEAARAVDLEFQVVHAVPPSTWALQGGELPFGLEFFGGRLQGTPLDTGTFTLTVRAVDATGLAASGTVEIRVGPPVLGVDALVGPFVLSGAAPNAAQLQYLDRAGNRNGIYDLGDLRAFVLDNPGLPMSAQDRGVLTGVIPLAPSVGGR